MLVVYIKSWSSLAEICVLKNMEKLLREIRNDDMKKYPDKYLDAATVKGESPKATLQAFWYFSH